MKRTTFLLIFAAMGIVMMTSSSCMKLLIRAMGEYKTPKPETPESIIAHCEKNDFNYDYLYMAINDSALAQVINHGYFSVGKIFPFDHQQRPIVINSGRNANGCPHVAAVDYQSQDTSVSTTISDTLDFWNRLSMMQLIHKRQELTDITLAIQDYDYFIVGTWAKMYPKISKNVHDDFRKAIAVDSTKKVCIISLNYDARMGNRFFKSVEKQTKQYKKAVKKAEKAAKKQGG